jgi:hypothetical protein
MKRGQCQFKTIKAPLNHIAMLVNAVMMMRMQCVFDPLKHIEKRTWRGLREGVMRKLWRVINQSASIYRLAYNAVHYFLLQALGSYAAVIASLRSSARRHTSSINLSSSDILFGSDGIVRRSTIPLIGGA